ncbi:MBL fold metallo-hydrolase RNA specificity domain-containing protein [Haloquadratum walsbyi]
MDPELHREGDQQSFLFDQASAARRMPMSREELLEADETPIIIAPSGMLSGGFSPTYLLEFCQRYDDARVILCGYQAEGTPGRQLGDAIEEDLERVGVTLPSNGLNRGIPDEGDGTRVKVPVSWISRYHGLSAHAAQNTLLQFARQVSPSQVYLIHGEQEQQEKMAQHLVDNLDSVSEIQLTGMMHPVSVAPDLPEEEIVGDRPAKRILDERGADIAVGDNAQFGSDAIHGTLSEFSDQIEALELALRTLSGQLAVERHDSGFSEEDIRRIVRDEMDEIVREAVEENQSN